MSISLQEYQRAERESSVAQARVGLTVHAVVTAFVWAVVVTLNLTVAREFPWSVFPVVGTGIGVFVHWWFGYRDTDELVRKHQLEMEARSLRESMR